MPVEVEAAVDAALPVETVAEAVVRHPPRSLVVHDGRIVARDGVYEGAV